MKKPAKDLKQGDLPVVTQEEFSLRKNKRALRTLMARRIINLSGNNREFQPGDSLKRIVEKINSGHKQTESTQYKTATFGYQTYKPIRRHSPSNDGKNSSPRVLVRERKSSSPGDRNPILGYKRGGGSPSGRMLDSNKIDPREKAHRLAAEHINNDDTMKPANIKLSMNLQTNKIIGMAITHNNRELKENITAQQDKEASSGIDPQNKKISGHTTSYLSNFFSNRISGTGRTLSARRKENSPNKNDKKQALENAAGENKFQAEETLSPLKVPGRITTHEPAMTTNSSANPLKNSNKITGTTCSSNNAHSGSPDTRHSNGSNGNILQASNQNSNPCLNNAGTNKIASDTNNNNNGLGITVNFTPVCIPGNQNAIGTPGKTTNSNSDQTNFSSNEGDDKTFRFKEEFSVGKIIGKGAYAIVRVGLQKKWNRRVAIKIYERKMLENPGRHRAVRSEISVLNKLQHPNVIQLYDVIESNNHLNLILEYVPGPSLQFYLKSKQRKMLREGEGKVMFRKIVEAVDYCHKMNINHRDLKLENILIDPIQGPKLIDFGFATNLPPNFKARIYCGTPTYMSPEIIKKEEYDGSKADMWALGVLLFILLTGNFPFCGKSEQEVFSKICKGSFIFPVELSTDAKQLVRNLLNMDPEKRMTAEETLRSPWLNSTELTRERDGSPPLLIPRKENTSRPRTGYRYPEAPRVPQIIGIQAIQQEQEKLPQIQGAAELQNLDFNNLDQDIVGNMLRMGYEFEEIKERLREENDPVKQVYVEMLIQKNGIGRTLYPGSGEVLQVETKVRYRDQSPGAVNRNHNVSPGKNFTFAKGFGDDN